MATLPNKQARLFYAVWPDDATRNSLRQLQAHIQGRKTHADDFHLTLAFLGLRPPELLPVLHDILQALPTINTSFVLDRFGYFEHNKVAWTGMTQPPPELFQLHSQLMQALERSNIPIYDRLEFHPHITLARKANAPGDMPFTPIIWQAKRIALVQSRPEAHDAKYEVLALR
ncbi:MAG TPA: RNA 2',3'-cyclic phosphodiesterase [Eoetvoesiella sp.]